VNDDDEGGPVTQRVDVVRRLFAAVEARDLAALLDCYGDRVEIHEMPSLPYGGVYRGRRGARDHAEAFFRAWGPFQLRQEPLEATFAETDDERVVVLFRHRAGDEARDLWLDEEEVGIYEVRDGVVERSSMVHPDPERLVRFLVAGSAR
jgi:ketosteroid isomerase-like protein